jgi:tetratricopeptide (TPR) repeat protein
LTLALSVYTVWAIRGLNHLGLLPAIAVFILSWFTWPVFYVLSRFVTSLPFFLLLPLVYVGFQYVRTFFSDRDRERELQAHLRSLTVNPRDADAHHQLGLICTRRGRFEEAERHLRSAIEIEPADPDHHYGLGRVYELRGDWARALERYEETYRLNPQYRLGDILREVGKGYLQTGKLEKATEFLEFFLGSRESDPEGHYWLAIAFHRTGKPAEARRQLNTILDQARSNPRFFRKEHRAWLQRARTHLRSPGDSWG